MSITAHINESGFVKLLKIFTAASMPEVLEYDSMSLVDRSGSLWRPMVRSWAWICERGLWVVQDFSRGTYSFMVLKEITRA